MRVEVLYTYNGWIFHPSAHENAARRALISQFFCVIISNVVEIQADKRAKAALYGASVIIFEGFCSEMNMFATRATGGGRKLRKIRVRALIKCRSEMMRREQKNFPKCLVGAHIHTHASICVHIGDNEMLPPPLMMMMIKTVCVCCLRRH